MVLITGHRVRFGRVSVTGGAEIGTPGEGLREFQPQRALSEAEGRRENGRGRGQAARRTHGTATGGAKNGTPGEGLREFGGEIDSGKGGTAGPLPLGRTQPQRALSEAEGRRENGSGRGQAARRKHGTATGGAESGTPGSFRRAFRDRWGGKRDTGIVSADIS